ncbi:MAG: ribosome-recycling factor [Gammaproteobacteria bacterium]|nr:MAG: ribosome-recycling factor [Gammaproteobacteria bacterium]
MIQDIKKDAEGRMRGAVEALRQELARMRTGRAHPSLIEAVEVEYYGNATPLKQVANITAEDARTLSVTPWDKSLVPAIEKAILNAGLGLNPVTAGTVIRVPLPPLTEERRRELVRLVRQEAESARVAIRNVRRDAMSRVKALLKDKAIGEDEERRAEHDIQALTDKYIEQVDQVLAQKEQDLLAV